MSLWKLAGPGASKLVLSYKLSKLKSRSYGLKILYKYVLVDVPVVSLQCHVHATSSPSNTLAHITFLKIYLTASQNGTKEPR